MKGLAENKREREARQPIFADKECAEAYLDFHAPSITDFIRHFHNSMVLQREPTGHHKVKGLSVRVSPLCETEKESNATRTRTELRKIYGLEFMKGVDNYVHNYTDWDGNWIDYD